MMKLSFSKSDLQNGINIVIKAVPTRTTMNILECILIEAKNGAITLTANDMELAIRTKVDGEIFEEGTIAVDAKIFSEIVRKLPDSEVILEETDRDGIRITCEKTRFTIAGRQGDDFAEMPKMVKKDYICLSQFTLKETIRQTLFSIAANENNKVMTGEFLAVKGNFFYAISLDGHRISIRSVELKDSYGTWSVIVPGKTLGEISRILSGDQDRDVYIFFSRSHILFEFDQTVVLSRLIEGKYFNVAQMISADYETRFTVNKREFTDSLERSLLLVRETDRKPIILDVENNEMKMSMNSFLGSLSEEIPIRKSGKDLMIGFNPRFLLDALRVIDDETVTIYMVNSKAPCFIRDEESSYIYLILPVNFSTPR